MRKGGGRRAGGERQRGSAAALEEAGAGVVETESAYPTLSRMLTPAILAPPRAAMAPPTRRAALAAGLAAVLIVRVRERERSGVEGKGGRVSPFSRNPFSLNLFLHPSSRPRPAPAPPGRTTRTCLPLHLHLLPPPITPPSRARRPSSRNCAPGRSPIKPPTTGSGSTRTTAATRTPCASSTRPPWTRLYGRASRPG